MKNLKMNLIGVLLTANMLAFAAKAGTEGGGTATEGKKRGAVDPNVIGKRRKLGLATVALIGAAKGKDKGALEAAIANAEGALKENGYENLKPQGERIADVQARLKIAIEANDGAAIQSLGKELEAVKAGRNYTPPKAKTTAPATATAS